MHYNPYSSSYYLPSYESIYRTLDYDPQASTSCSSLLVSRAFIAQRDPASPTCMSIPQPHSLFQDSLYESGSPSTSSSSLYSDSFDELEDDLSNSSFRARHSSSMLSDTIDSLIEAIEAPPTASSDPYEIPESTERLQRPTSPVSSAVASTSSLPTFPAAATDVAIVENERTKKRDTDHRHHPYYPAANATGSNSSSTDVSRRASSSHTSRNHNIWPDWVEKEFKEAFLHLPKIGKKQVVIEGKAQGRNELIALYLLEKCNVERTRKQISSHIQVLKSRDMASNDSSTTAFYDDLLAGNDEFTEADRRRWFPKYRLGSSGAGSSKASSDYGTKSRAHRRSRR